MYSVPSGPMVRWTPALKRVAVVASRTHDSVTGRLVEGALGLLRKADVPEDSVDLFWVPGSFELPQAVDRAAASGKYGSIVAIGCVVRGETSHFDFICQATFRGLDEVARSRGVPVTLGVLTVDSLDQAYARAGGKFGNKGEEAARAALEMAGLAGKFHG